MSTGNTFPTFGSAVGNTVNFLSQKFGSSPGLSSALKMVNQRVSKGHISTVRRAELELLKAARVSDRTISMMIFLHAHEQSS